MVVSTLSPALPAHRAHSTKMTKLRSGPHWFVPTTLLVAFIAGIALACGHHYFYSTLQDQRVDQARWSQDTNTAIGTALAFLVRAAFVIAISTVYWQSFWHRLREPLSLSKIDDLADQLKVLYQLFNWNNLKASPLLGALALVAWLIPLAVVFPPATLKVVPKEFRSHEMREFHVPDFNNSEMFVRVDYSKSDYGYGPSSPVGVSVPAFVEWAGPTSPIRRTLFGTAYQGQLPVFSAPEANSSYGLTFNGPSIQCGPMDDASSILSGLTRAGVQCLNGSTACNTPFQTYYLAWVAESQGNQTENYVAFNISDKVYNYDFPVDTYLGTNNEKPQALYLAYRDNMASRGLESEGTNMLNCTLYNATYVVSVNFDSGIQDVKIDGLKLLNATKFRQGGRVDTYPDSFVHNVPEVRSYLAYMEIVGELLLGMLYTRDLPRTTSTRVLETELAFTDELYPLYVNFTGSKILSRPLRPLKDTLEELFQNMTLSLLTMPELRSSQPTMSNVTISHTHNAYRYNAPRLFLAYGAATAGTLLTVVTGLYSLVITGTSYSNKFSTVVRVARDQAIDVHIQHKDRLGQDPLPPYIGRSRLHFDRNESDETSEMETSSRELRPSDDVVGPRSMEAKTAYVQTSLLRG